MDMQHAGLATKPEKILGADEVAERLNIARSTLYKLIKTRQFRPGIRITNGLVGWPASEVEAWIEQRKRERDEKLSEQAA